MADTVMRGDEPAVPQGELYQPVPVAAAPGHVPARQEDAVSAAHRTFLLSKPILTIIINQRCVEEWGEREENKRCCWTRAVGGKYMSLSRFILVD